MAAIVALQPSNNRKKAGLVVFWSGVRFVGTMLHMNAIQTAGIALALACLLDTVAATGAQKDTIRSLKKGAFSGIRDVKQEVIKSAEAWEKLWKQHSTAAGASDKMPAVDFSKEMVIVATMGTKRTGGYTIEIVDVEAKDKALKISIKKTAPPPDAMTIQALTAPFHFVAVPRSDLKPEFVEVKPSEKQ
jgi:hypothetical protein